MATYIVYKNKPFIQTGDEGMAPVILNKKGKMTDSGDPIDIPWGDDELIIDPTDGDLEVAGMNFT